MRKLGPKIPIQRSSDQENYSLRSCDYPSLQRLWTTLKSFHSFFLEQEHIAIFLCPNVNLPVLEAIMVLFRCQIRVFRCLSVYWQVFEPFVQVSCIWEDYPTHSTAGINTRSDYFHFLSYISKRKIRFFCDVSFSQGASLDRKNIVLFSRKPNWNGAQRWKDLKE